ncbi:MAG TPA: hypothetical protein LFW21_02710 [Rickettsia endosymbiont of Pyrocoelia pectoralis]|nr:hypothetical protein [Rickettsia endosymbiont of Pyrocoelia pectoralis]
MIAQGNSQPKPNNPKLIILPEGKIIDNSKLKPILKNNDLDLMSFYESIPIVKNIKAVAEVISYSLENLPKTRDYLTFKQNLMAKLFINYKYEEFANNVLLTKYKIVELAPNEFQYMLDKSPYSCSLEPKETKALNYNENAFLKTKAIGIAIYAAIKNNHIKTAEELIREILKTADINLSVFKASNYPKYNECTKIIASLIDILELEPKIQAF